MTHTSNLLNLMTMMIDKSILFLQDTYRFENDLCLELICILY